MRNARDRRGLGLAGVAVVGLLAAGPAAAAVNRFAVNDAKTRPVVLVHGWSLQNGVDCGQTWAQARQVLARNGFSGPSFTFGYARGDHDCDVGPADGFARTPIDDLAKKFAWTVHDQFTARQQPVNVLAHSMGGLIVRDAIDGVQKKREGFPPTLAIPEVVTLGTPHAGTVVAGACVIGTQQCDDMLPWSPFIRRLEKTALHPDATGGTVWTTIGSLNDGIVGGYSAIRMAADHMYIFLLGQNLGHSDLRTDDRTGPVSAYANATLQNMSYKSMYHSSGSLETAVRSLAAG